MTVVLALHYTQQCTGRVGFSFEKRGWNDCYTPPSSTSVSSAAETMLLALLLSLLSVTPGTLHSSPPPPPTPEFPCVTQLTQPPASCQQQGGSAGNGVISVAVMSYASEVLHASCRATFLHCTMVQCSMLCCHLSGVLTTDVVAVHTVCDPSLEGKVGEENCKM